MVGVLICELEVNFFIVVKDLGVINIIYMSSYKFINGNYMVVFF